jgi:hypothetical protein
MLHTDIGHCLGIDQPGIGEEKVKGHGDTRRVAGTSFA